MYVLLQQTKNKFPRLLAYDIIITLIVSKMFNNDTNENGHAILLRNLSICFALEYKIKKKLNSNIAVNPLLI